MKEYYKVASKVLMKWIKRYFNLEFIIINFLTIFSTILNINIYDLSKICEMLHYVISKVIKGCRNLYILF